jgi:hypothetical protein
MPVVRQIVRQAARDQYRFGTIVQGIVSSTPFQMRVRPVPADPSGNRVAVSNADAGLQPGSKGPQR